EYWWFYGAFSAFVLLLLALDLGIVNRKAHAIGFREASIWTAVWASLALLFCLGLYAYAGSKFGPGLSRQVALEFLTGYIVEWSLSLDNMFVFVVVFGYFGIPARFQHRILFYGIMGALIFRAGFIAVGSVLLQYAWMVVIFGVFLVITGTKMFFGTEQPVDLERSPILRMLRKYLPITANRQGHHFFERIDGKRFATPLLVTLIFIEMTDIVFAIDSVPAIF